jgi:hypothetical protein
VPARLRHFSGIGGKMSTVEFAELATRLARAEKTWSAISFWSGGTYAGMRDERTYAGMRDEMASAFGYAALLFTEVREL